VGGKLGQACYAMPLACGPTNIVFLGLGLCSTLGIGYVPLDKLMRAGLQ